MATLKRIQSISGCDGCYFRTHLCTRPEKVIIDEDKKNISCVDDDFIYVEVVK